MNDHALEVLEFGRVLERVASRASSDVGRARILALRPGTDPHAVARELDRVGAVMRFVGAAPTWAPGMIPDVRDDLSYLGVEGSLLEPLGLVRIGRLLASSRSLARELQAHAEPYPELETITLRLVDLRPLEQAIERCVDEEGQVLSSASDELKRIRDRLRGAHAKIVRLLERYLGTLPERFVVGDASVTLREGRYVIPVRREGKGEVGGIVHDESQTGATLYVEPPVAIEAMNRLRDLERDEAREIRRVLGEITTRLAPDRDAMSGAFDALADFDSLHARARAAVSWDAVPPTVLPGRPEGFELRGARHPLLIEAREGPVIPYDLTMGPAERCLVVSGPNTGGKSVFLKATGLIAALTQSGVIPPVGKGTRIPVFAHFFADIGDEQSIARNLSTFSAHLANLSGIVSEADDGSLVLIDEMGTGTDPAEGAALSRAVLEELVARGATTIASSHLGELKQLDTPESGIVNASLQFDGEQMAPTYRLIKGRPGRSYGLAIARRLGFPGEVLDRAETYRDQGEVRMEELLARLEAQEREVERLLHELDLERTRTERLRTDVERRAHTLQQAERTAEDRAHSDARKLLMEARGEVEDAIRGMREAVRAGRDLDEAAREARRSVEGAAGRHAQATADGGRKRRGSGAGNGVAPGGFQPSEGDRVRIRSTGAKGLVAEVRADRCLVEVGALRFEVPRSEIEPVDAPKTEPKRGSWSGPEKEEVRTEVDLRGMRVDEMQLELERALDHAVLEDLGELRIIHGKGTGALRQRVGEILATDRRVREHRMGGRTEGGSGVTVALLGGAG
jgi:DNA mismatch repair protein MutS2